MAETNGDLSLREAQRLIEQYEQRWRAHEREHELIRETIDGRFQAHNDIHREHAIAHEREHSMTDDALTKATDALDKRLESMNEFRGQLRDQAARFASAEALQALQREMDRRMAERDKTLAAKIETVQSLTLDKYEANRQRIELLEKGDVKQEGRQMGTSALAAVIVTAIGLVGTVLAIIIVVINLVTGA